MGECLIEDFFIYPVILKVDSADIVLLKFFLESYEHLGVLRTIDPGRGIVAVLSVKDVKPELELLLKDLQRDLNFRVIEQAELQELGFATFSSWGECNWLVDS